MDAFHYCFQVIAVLESGAKLVPFGAHLTDEEIIGPSILLLLPNILPRRPVFFVDPPPSVLRGATFVNPTLFFRPALPDDRLLFFVVPVPAKLLPGVNAPLKGAPRVMFWVNVFATFESACVFGPNTN